MLNIHNLSVSFAGEYLFEEITFRLGMGDKVGLVGKNGAGKSTMLKLLSKELQPDTGTIASEKDIKIGFLKQDIDFVKGRTVLEEAYQAFEDIKHLEQKIASLNHQLSVREDYESAEYLQLIDELSDCNHQFEIVGGYNYVGDTEKILLGLGFKRDDFQKLTDTFSGGWRMRIELAKLLLQNNDVLLLDEPTNHLDIESIIWLESFLKNYTGVVVIVSHDKMFLDNVTNRTIEISLGKAYDFPKPYSQYLTLRNEIREKQLATQKNQEKMIEHTEKLIEKFRAKASKAAMAQSLIKKLDKVERIEVDQDDNSVMSISFPQAITPGKVVIEVQNVTKKYGDKTIFKNLSLLVERGSKIAFVGQNGQGKSTFVKAIVNEIDYQGTIKLGHNVLLGYFAQNQVDYLNGEITLLETMEEAANDSNRSKVRDMLGAFLFKGDDVHKKVKVLSGGERNRLALCKMLLQPINVLIMDEPTNHLDIKSKNVLKGALQQFEGTLLVVSHDRDFLQGLSNIVYEFKDQSIREYLGDIDFYLEQRKLDNMRDLEKNTPNKKDNPVVENTKTLNFEEQKQRKSLQNRLGKVEKLIEELEQKITTIELELAQNYTTLSADQSFMKKYTDFKNQLSELTLEWEDLITKLDS
ncbi:MAG: ABC-F family ATP-binding cassette domain-containing protein [Bacteroidota bacterium]|nr:ABC-F family ATP-binding cassette domain-containing protein [Bacteroidota bacterium]